MGSTKNRIIKIIQKAIDKLDIILCVNCNKHDIIVDVIENLLNLIEEIKKNG